MKARPKVGAGSAQNPGQFAQDGTAHLESLEAKLLGRLRKICLSLPEVRETVKWGHPTFEAGKKIFAVLDHYEGQLCIAFRAPMDRQAKLRSDQRFFPAPYAATHGWFCLRAEAKLNWTEVRDLVVASHRLVALKRMLLALPR